MIEAKNLTMFYGSTRALDQVSFKINEKEIVGLLGPNGAGKTTLMRILTTFIYPTQGTALVNGFDILEDPLNVRKSLGYLPETPPLYSDMRVDEFIRFIGQARGLSGKNFKVRKDWVIEACGIAAVWKHTIYELSLGFRQRVGLAQALLHDPKVVILDEPTSGLDPVQIIGIRSLIKELSKTKTILFSTHILQEVSAISHRILMINQGRLALQGTPSELRSAGVHKEELFRLVVDAKPVDVQNAFLSVPCVKRVVLQEEYQGTPCFLLASSSYAETVKAVNEIIRSKNWTLKELSRQEPSLEDIFLNTFKKSDKNKPNST